MLKILIVDDELDFLTILEERIKSWGYNCLKVSNGKEAIEAVKEKAPDIVVLDYVLPDIDGITVMEEIKKLYPLLPVIMLTAYPDGRSIREAEKLGVSAFIPKLSSNSTVELALQGVLQMLEKKMGKKD